MYIVALLLSVLGIPWSSKPPLIESDVPGLYVMSKPKTWWGKPRGAILALGGAIVGASASVISLFPELDA